MNKSVTVLEGNGYNSPSIVMDESVSQNNIDDFIIWNKNFGIYYNYKKDTKIMDNSDIKSFGEQSIKDFMEASENYTNKSKTIPMIHLTSTKFERNQWTYGTYKNEQYKFNSLINMADKTLYDAFKSLEPNNFDININWDSNKRCIHCLNNMSTYRLHDLILNPDLLRIEEPEHYVHITSNCFHRYDNKVFYNHYFKFIDVYKSIDHLNSRFRDVKMFSKYYELFIKGIENGKFGFIDFVNEKLALIEAEMDKPEHWNEEEYKDDYYGY